MGDETQLAYGKVQTLSSGRIYRGTDPLSRYGRLHLNWLQVEVDSTIAPLPTMQF